MNGFEETEVKADQAADLYGKVIEYEALILNTRDMVAMLACSSYEIYSDLAVAARSGGLTKELTKEDSGIEDCLDRLNGLTASLRCLWGELDRRYRRF